MGMTNPIRLGTRGSALARWQTDHVAALLRAAWPSLQVEVQVISTRGDRVLDTPLPLVGGKGLFTAELEHALRSGAVDFAVHSLKDLPTEDAPGLTVGAIPLRAATQDVLVSRRGQPLDDLPPGAVIGTSSHRRAAQLLHHRPDLHIQDIRGNVDTRVRKALDPKGPYDATVLARAGLERLGLLDGLQIEGLRVHVLPAEVMLPAPGQGALAIQCRDDAASLALLAPLADPGTTTAVHAERAFLAGLGGGCSLPAAALARVRDGQVHLHGRVSGLDGRRQIDVHGDAPLAEAARLGSRLAEEALAAGAQEILAQITSGAAG